MNNIDVIVDGSGSMAEWGKRELTEYLLHSLDNYIASGLFGEVNVTCYLWNEGITEIIDKSGITVSGKSDVACFLAFARKSGNGTLLLSDGNFDIGKRRDVTGSYIVPVAVGCEHNKAPLKALAHNNVVYGSESLITALNVLCFGGD